MEDLQMWKFALKQCHLYFTKYWDTPEPNLLELELVISQDLLANILSGCNSEDVINKIIQDFGEDCGGDQEPGGTI